MINLALSIVVGALVSLGIHLAGFGWFAAFAPGVLLMVGAYVLLARRTASMVQKLGEQVQGQLSTAPRTEKERDAMLDRAIKTLEQGFDLGRWQFFIGQAIHGQVGMLLYMKKDAANAVPHLEKAMGREWMAKSMLGCIHFTAKNADAMKAAFEKAVDGGKKEALAWAAYAWCLENSKRHDDAIAVASRAVTENPSDEKLKKLQNQLQNGKRLKMNAFEPGWWQFGLEKPPVEMPRPQMRFARGRRG